MKLLSLGRLELAPRSRESSARLGRTLCKLFNGENADGLSMKCVHCEHTGWVCENHPDAPWDGEQACICGGAGMPCPQCNPSDLSHPPRPPAGTHIEFDKDGWRH